MDITYHGHSCFKIKSKEGIVVMDPYDDYIGMSLSKLSADVVTSSHDHKDHRSLDRVKPTTKREEVFAITHPGEYEVGGISVFGVPTFHDDSQGSERGANIIFTVVVEGIRVCHLGDLGHELTDTQKTEVGDVDVLLVPVGGVYTIDPKQAKTIIHSLEPSYIVPMHFKTSQHDEKVFGDLKTVEEFLQVYGAEVQPQDSLRVEAHKLPEETEMVVLRNRG